LAAILLHGCASAALAQAPGIRFEYSAKVVCGVQEDPDNMRLARGFYASAINIHNPTDSAVFFDKILALTFPPEEQKPGDVIQISRDQLRSDEALEVDCLDIQRRLFPGGFPNGYIKGFVVIRSSGSLDVAGVYSSASIEEGELSHSSIDVEHVPERQIGPPRLPDLLPVPDSTGEFCRLRENFLVVTVRNQGAGPAGASTTRVSLSGGGIIDQSTPTLSPGVSTDLLFDIRTCSYSPDCTFEIFADATGMIAESNEANNIAKGVCKG
jgi:hypothetical protein